MKIRIDGFGGIAPRMSPKLLPNYAAQVADNVRLESGEIRPVTIPSILPVQLVPNALSVYPLGAPNFDYLSWAVDVDVAASPIADDENRIYYTGDGLPKKTRSAMLVGPNPEPGNNWYYMGTPAPVAAPTLASSGSGSITETRVYVYTYVTEFGAVEEESQPSPPATITLSSADGVGLTGLADPVDTSNRNYTKKRIYRSVGAGAFQLVAEIAFALTSFTDNLTLIPGDELVTTTWAPPPDDLKGLTLLANGGMAGFRNNEIWFSEPGFPHAWPPEYMQTVNSRVVAIRAFGNSLAVGTEGYPEIGTGIHPDSFTFQLISRRLPCSSKRSMAGDQAGATYASPDGLVYLGYDSTGLATAQLVTRREFARFAPATMIGASYNQKYYGFFDRDGAASAIVFQMADVPPLTTLSLPIVGCALEDATGRLLGIRGDTNQLVYIDPMDTLPMSYTWKSKLFEIAFPTNFGAIRVLSEDVTLDDLMYEEFVEQQNVSIQADNEILFATGNLEGALNARPLNGLSLNGSILTPLLQLPSRDVTLTVFANTEVVFSERVPVNTAIRLPAGFTAKNWEIQVGAQVPIQAIEMATSVEDLSQ